MRRWSIAVVVCGTFSSGNASATSPALIVSVVESEAIGVRIHPATVKGGYKNIFVLCSSDKPLVEAIVSPGKPLVFDGEGHAFCVSQTHAPFTKVGWTTPIPIRHHPGDPAYLLALHTRDAPPPSVTLQVADPNVPPTPFVVELADDEKIGVRVSEGTTTPCTSSDDVPLFTGVLYPSQPIVLRTHATCVCVQQTTAPFVSVGWNEGSVRCRPSQCQGKGCKIDLGRTWGATLFSKGP